MKYTLLELCQAIASSMDSDEFTSINDTTESLQIATVVRTTYFDIINRTRIPEHYKLIQLQETDANTPIIMELPSDVSKVEWVKFDVQTALDTDVVYRDLKYLPFDVFFDMTQKLDPADTFVNTVNYTVDGNTFTIYCRNDAAPQFYTSIEDGVLLFDSFDSEIDTFLPSSKTMASGRKIITWSMTDEYTPDLDEPQFELLLNEAKALAWAELKQTQHSKAEQTARRHWLRSQRTKYSSDMQTDFDKLPFFGRKP